MKKKKTGLYFVIGLIGIIVFSIVVSNITGKDETKNEVKFNNVSYSEYKKLFESEGLEFIMVGKTGCGWCDKIKPLLGQIQEEEKIKFNYLDIAKIKDEELNDISTTAEIFKGDWGTPTLLALVDGKVVDSVTGYEELDKLREFVKSAKAKLEEANK